MITYLRKYLHVVAAPLILAAVAFSTSTPAKALSPKIHCSQDTVKVMKIVREIAGKGGTYGERIILAAKALDGTPFATPEESDTIGMIEVNLHGFDRMGFANTVMALAQASIHSLPRVEEFASAYESLSRRKGTDQGFASQLVYGSDWVVDNVYRGNMKEMTEYLGGGGFKTKTLDYMTRHRDQYPAMKNQDVFDKVRMNEMGYRSHRIPHLKKQSGGNKELINLLEDGDIIMILTPEIDFDYYDIGFVEMVDGEPCLHHISHDSGKVEADPYPLSRRLKLDSQFIYGYRWLRPVME